MLIFLVSGFAGDIPENNESIVYDVDSRIAKVDSLLIAEILSSAEWKVIEMTKKTALKKIRSVLDSGISKEELSVAYKRELDLDSSSGPTASKIIFGSTFEANIFEITMKGAVDNLLEKYPALSELMENSKSTCGEVTGEKVDFFVDNFDAVYADAFYEATGTSGAMYAERNCKWVQYTACLLVCSAGGPVAYFPCAYLCLCAFCDNSVTERVCF